MMLVRSNDTRACRSESPEFKRVGGTGDCWDGAKPRRMRRCSIQSLTGLLAIISLAGQATAGDLSGAKSIFAKRCTACHTYGKGIKVGPDLKGVTDRRGQPWLLEFIRSSSKMIASGDPTATALFRKFKQERMPDWSDLSAGQVQELIAYFRANGPEQKEPDERDALTATRAEIAAGRQLFHGQLPLSYGSQSCNACHSLRDSVGTGTGSLGPDLSVVYLKYRDKSLTDFLKRPCFRSREDSSGNYLTPQESFNLKSYLAYVAGWPIPAAYSRQLQSLLPRGISPGVAPKTKAVTLTGWYYVAFGLFAGGLVLRAVTRRRREDTPSVDPAGSKRMFPNAVIWQVAFMLMAISHLIGLAFPEEILHWDVSPLRLYILEGLSAVVGLIVFGGWVWATWRYFGEFVGPVVRQTADGIFLACFFIETVSGLLTAILYRWASWWAALTLAPYLRSLLAAKPTTALAGGLPFIVQLHVFPAFLMFAVFPFTRSGLRVAEAAQCYITYFVQRITEWGRSAVTTLWRRYNPSAWLWPEED